MKPKKCLSLALLFIWLLSQGTITHASTREGLERSIKEKQEEIKKLEAQAEVFRQEIGNKEKEASGLKQEISLIETKIKKLSNYIRVTTKEIEKTNFELDLIQDELTTIEKTTDRQKKNLAIVFQELYEKRKENLIVVALRYDRLSDILTTIEGLSAVEASLKNSLDNLHELHEIKTESEQSAQQKKDQLAELKTTLRVTQLSATNEAQDRKTLLAKTRNAESQYQKLLQQTEAQRITTLKETEKLEEELRKTIDPSSVPKGGSGILAWPIDSTLAMVTQGYGQTAFARQSDFYQFHNGIDICPRNPFNPKTCDPLGIGTPVLAAEGGAVVGVGNSDEFCWKGSYGRWITIQHGNNLTTLYTHLSSINVQKGDRVKRGQIIGTMGSSGLATGPHLHFTVYVTTTFSVKPSRICGLLPYGGSLNPVDYL